MKKLVKKALKLNELGRFVEITIEVEGKMVNIFSFYAAQEEYISKEKDSF